MLGPPVKLTVTTASVPAFTSVPSFVLKVTVTVRVSVPEPLTLETFTVVLVVLAAYAGRADVATTAGTVHAAPAKTVRRLKPL